MKKISLVQIVLLGIGLIMTACGSGGGSGDRSGDSEFIVSGGNPASLTTIRVSVDSGGNQSSGGNSYNASVSSDGRYVAFESDATNLIANDTNGGVRDIFVNDRTTGLTTVVSVNANGTQGNASSFLPSVSADGRYVAFESVATNLIANDTNGAVRDIFMHDRITGSTTVVSVSSNSTQGNASSFLPSVSADGRYVAFESDATNLIANDTNGAVRDIFMHDRTTGSTTVVSVNSNRTQGNASSFSPSVSADGRYVAFESVATDLIANDTNGVVRDIFVNDRTTGTTTVVSVNSNGTQGNNDSFASFISANGIYVAFESLDSNLVSNDSNGLRDIFVREH